MPAFPANSPTGYTVSTLVGLIFGFVMNKARVIEPLVIRDQMVMQRFVMLKLFLTASATSALVFTLLYKIKATRANVISCQNNMGSLMNRGYYPFIVGGLLLGVGLDLAGTCPGMVFVELGAFIQNSGWTILGCFVGTFLYILLQPLIEKLSSKEGSKYPKTMMDITGLSYPTLAIIFAIVMYAVVWIVETIVPWRYDVSSNQPMSWSSYAWSPVLSGLIIGLSQLPLMGLLSKMLGTSMSYMNVLAQIYDNHQELKDNKRNYWQTFLAIGSILGSYISSYMYMGRWNVFNSTVIGASPSTAFIGGICILLGAKTMRACTSGHGLSGMPLMSVASIVATMCIFSGGIICGLLVNKFL